MKGKLDHKVNVMPVSMRFRLKKWLNQLAFLSLGLLIYSIIIDFLGSYDFFLLNDYNNNWAS